MIDRLSVINNFAFLTEFYRLPVAYGPESLDFVPRMHTLSNVAVKQNVLRVLLEIICSVSLSRCQKVKRSKVKEIIVLIKARSFLDELNLEHLTS